MVLDYVQLYAKLGVGLIQFWMVIEMIVGIKMILEQPSETGQTKCCGLGGLRVMRYLVNGLSFFGLFIYFALAVKSLEYSTELVFERNYN